MNSTPGDPVPPAPVLAAPGEAALSTRHRRVAAALVVVALVALGVASTLLVHDPNLPAPRVVATSSRASPISVPTTQSPLDERRALAALLDTRRQAVLSGNREAWLSTVDRQDRSFYTAQAKAFDNLGDVPFSDWTYKYLDRATLTPARASAVGPHAWVARVMAGYQLRGHDSAPAYSEQHLTVVQRGQRWLLASTADGLTTPQPWDFGRIRIVRGDRVLVLGNAPRATLEVYAAAGDRAIGRVSAVWGTTWSQRAVLVAPRTQRQFGQLLQRKDEGLAQVAAVTTGDLESSRDAGAGRGGSDRVVINPAAFTRLDALGRRVVLTHEMTHVAVRQSTAASVPIWLSEGFADFLGYRGTGITRRDGAGDVLAQVRDGHGPRNLPQAKDFDPQQATIAPSYSASWLACSLISDQYGTEKLVALYRAAATAPATGTPSTANQLHAAFPQVLGISEEAFTQRWRGYLDRLAR